VNSGFDLRKGVDFVASEASGKKGENLACGA